MKKISLLLTFLFVIIICFFVEHRLSRFFDLFDNRYIDSLMFFSYKARGEKIEKKDEKGLDSNNIIVIELDDDSYTKIDEIYSEYNNLSSQKRRAFIDTVDYIIENNPRMILFDFTFEYFSDEKTDEKFKETLKKAINKGVDIVIGSKLIISQNFNGINIEYKKPVFDFENGILNQVFQGKMVREPVLFVEKDGEFINSFAMQSFLNYMNIDEYEIKGKNLEVGSNIIPLTIEKSQSGHRIAKFPLFYTLTWESITAFPISAFIDKNMKKEYEGSFRKIIFKDNKSEEISVFKDSVVFFGTSSADDQDLVSYPFSDFVENVVPGVHIHINSFLGLVNKNYFSNISSKSVNLIQLLIIVICFYIFYKTKPFRAFLIFVLLMFLISLCSSILFIYFGVFIKISIMIFCTVAVFISVQTYKFFFESKEKREIRGAFSKYISPELVSTIVEKPDMLKLGGVEKELTILFSDIANFTSLSEKIGAVNLVSFLNEYLSAMTDILMQNSGTLDKYIGDAVMAFWGAPVDDEKHSYKACKTAILMMQKLEELKKEWKKKGYPDLNIRIGLNTGKVVVGNMGSAKRFNYTVMGDPVNLASRLEGLNKEYGTFIMVSETVYNKNKDNFDFRELDMVKVKGKNEPVRVYELLLKKPDENYKEAMKSYENALKLYRSGEFEKAYTVFDKVEKKLSGDSVCATFKKRCQILKDNIPDDWNGVWQMKTK